MEHEHGIPHFHAIYGEHNAVFSIKNAEVIEGDLPSRADRMVKEWAIQHKSELMKMWQGQEFHQIPGLE